MSLQTNILIALAGGILATTATATAQIERPPVYPGKIGFSIAGLQGTAGIICSGFSCTAKNLNLVRGETLNLAIRTNLGSKYLLLVGGITRTCVKLPGLNNSWVGASTVVAIGDVNQRDRIRCWGGLATPRILVPRNLNLQDSFLLQVVADNSSGPSFSAPVRVTIRR